MLVPERAGGDCGLIGCAALDQDDGNPIARQCIRRAGHEGPHRFVPCGELEDAEELSWFHLGGEGWRVIARIRGFVLGTGALGSVRLA